MFQMNSEFLINEIAMLTVEVVICILLFAYQEKKGSMNERDNFNIWVEFEFNNKVLIQFFQKGFPQRV